MQSEVTGLHDCKGQSALKGTFPNIGYAASGYNIYTGKIKPQKVLLAYSTTAVYK